MVIFKASKSSDKTGEQNLYIAYYARVPKPTSPGRYHAALVVLPAPATASTPIGRLVSALRQSSNISAKAESTKFHVVNVPVPDESGTGRVSWDYRVEKDDIPALGTKLRMRLVALMLVGPITAADGLSGGETAEQVVSKVDIPKYVDLRPEWKCTSFLYEALKLLETSQTIPSLPTVPLPEFWAVGVQFADKWRTEESVTLLASGGPIRCCDREGNEIPSPIGPTT